MSNKPRTTPPADGAPAASPAPAPSPAPQPADEPNPTGGGCFVRDPSTGQIAPDPATAAAASE